MARHANNILAKIFGAKVDHGSFKQNLSPQYSDGQQSHNELELINPFDPANHGVLLGQICSTHDNTVKNNYEHSSLFNIVQNIFERSTQILDEIVQVHNKS